MYANLRAFVPRRISLTLLVAGTVNIQAENPEPRAWFSTKEDTTANFYSIQREFYRAWEKEEDEAIKTGNPLAKSAASGFEEDEQDELFQFKRWESYMEPRVYPSGDLTLPSKAAEEAAPYFGLSGTTVPDMKGNWKSIGPNTIPTSGGGAGRLNFIRFDPRNPNTMYVGSPGGGLWFTNGSSTSNMTWKTNTDNITVLGVSDIVIDPEDTQIQYMATGDGDGSDTRSIGVLKSEDGGLTWNTTGLVWAVSLGRRISKLLMNPDNSSIILAAASNGIYRTADAGLTWTQVSTQSTKDMEFKPNDPNTIYAVGTRFYKSTNGGVSFASASNLPTVSRMSIAVTAANPNVVYVLGANQRDFQGFYRSSDGGNNFSTRATSPNILGYSSTGSDVGEGQAFYDLGMTVSPTNSEYVVICGVNVWISKDGGSNWKVASNGVHVDVHAVEFYPGNENILFAVSDGGIYRTENGGTNWSNLGNTLAISEMYRFGVSARDPNKILSGWQDNGTNMLSGGIWKHVYGGDGFECFFDWADTNSLYAETQNGGLVKTTNGGKNWSNITPSGQTGPWSTAWIQDPKDAQVLYYGSTNLFKSSTRGSDWQQLGTLPGSGSVRNITVDPSNNKNIFVVKATSLARSTDGGNNWTSISTALPTSSASINHVTVDYANSNILWACLSGYTANTKVYKSTNGGTSWTNYSEGLPNLPANSIIPQKSTNGGVYVAMDVGVYYRDNSMSAWVPFFANLPNVSVRELDIYYAPNLNDSKIRVATFGRGIWESYLYNAEPPVSVSKGKSAPKNFMAISEKHNHSITLSFTSEEAQPYSVEITDLKGAHLQSIDLGVVSKAYRGRLDLNASVPTGIQLITLKSPRGRNSYRLLLH
jgi:photosystem II stability/assembly factor-like uncharacterized protein